MEQEFVKRKGKRIGRIENKKLEQIAALQSPYEEHKSKEFQEPKQSRMPLREIPVNSAVDVFRKPKAPKSAISPSPDVQSNSMIPRHNQYLEIRYKTFQNPQQPQASSQNQQQVLPSAPIPPKLITIDPSILK